MNKIFIVFLIVAASLIRLAPHPPNFTPILSIALFSGVFLKNKYGFLIPMIIMVLSDFYIGNYQMSIWVYSSLLIIYFMGENSQKFNTNFILKTSVFGSFIFFLTTNFGVWIVGYPKSLDGILTCYIAALPFYKNTLISTLLYSSVFYLIYVLSLKVTLLYNKK